MAKNSPQISIIVLNYNGKKWLPACFQSIYNQTFTNFETILVDNNSQDGSKEYTKKNWPQIKIIANRDNLGYALANNIAARRAQGKYLFFLNSDTKLHKQTLKNLLWKAQVGQKGILSPKIKGYKGQEIFPPGLPYLGMDRFSYPGPSKILFYADGAALFIPKKIFRELKGFDEKHFIFQEDIDLCWRAQLLGYNIIAAPRAIVYHQSGATIQGGTVKHKQHFSSLFRRYHTEKNSLRNIIKNYETVNLFKIFPLHCLMGIGESIIYFSNGRFKAGGIILKAIIWNIAHFQDTLKERQRIQKTRKIKDKEIILRMLRGSMKWQAFKNIGGVPHFK